jgi:hypothetical protein
MTSSLSPFFNKLQKVVDQHRPILNDAELEVHSRIYDARDVQFQHARYEVTADWFGTVTICVKTVAKQMELSMEYHQARTAVSSEVFCDLMQGQKRAFNLANEIQIHVDDHNQCG